MPGLGIDIAGVTDIEPTLNFATPEQTAAESVMTSLLHPAGLLWWAPTVGDDIRRFLHDSFDKEGLERAVVAQAVLDERVTSATAFASIVGNDIFVTGTLTLVGSAEPTQFTLGISQAGEVIVSTAG